MIFDVIQCARDGPTQRVGDNATASMHLPWFPTFALSAHDRLRVSVDNDPQASVDCVLHGTLYQRTRNHVFLSCGGMLLKLPASITSLTPGECAYVNVSKTRRRRRDV